MWNQISQPRRQPLFTPVEMGKLRLPDRIIMASLTRMRAANPGHAPTELHAEYYAQRASAGLIIGECTEISPDAFLFEIVETVLAHVEPGRVGFKVGPMHLSGPFAANDDTLPGMEYVIKKLNDYDLAHLLLMGATTDFRGSPLEQLAGDGMFQHFRPLYQGHLIANVDMTQERANRLIEAGLADSIAFGRPYIANPDLPMRFLTGAVVEERELGGPWLKTRVEAGDLFLTASQSPYELRWRAIGPEPFKTMHLYLGLPVFNRAMEEAFQKDQGATHLRDLSGFKDNFLSVLLEGLHKELSSRHRGSSLFVEGIAQSLAGHLVRTYADETTQEYRGGLPGFRLHKVRDLMVTHLEDELSLIRLARHDDEGQKLVTELRKLGAEAEFVRTDVRHEEEVKNLVDKTIARFGRLDIAVNNAGTEGKPGPLTDQTAESYAATSDTNVLGTK